MRHGWTIRDLKIMPVKSWLLWILSVLFIIPVLTRKRTFDWAANSLREYHPNNHINSNNTITNLTVQLGTSAYLRCHVMRQADRMFNGADIRGGLVFTKQVSWVRRRDWHILSSGMFTYTNDERFQVLHPEGSDDWTLQIKYVQKRDNGTYECQIATGSGIISQFVNVNIVEPNAYIVGSGEHHVDIGSVIRLVCVIEKSPQPPQYVFWYHNDRMINYDMARGSISVDTDPRSQLTQSRLVIDDANDSDSGNYSCVASNTEPASIHVFVSEGDKMAAISRRKAITTLEATSSSASKIFISSLLLLIILFLDR